MRRLGALAEVALGRQRSPEHEAGPHMTAYLRAANVKDGYLDLIDVKEMNFSPREQANFGLRRGDVLVTEGAGSLAAVGAAAVWSAELPGVTCFQNTLLRLRPRPGVDGRYLAWWARHAYADRRFAAEATGVNIYHLSAERVRSIPAPHPRLKQQRAIADFLDVETERIDRMVANRVSAQALLHEWLAARFEAVVWRNVVPVPLARRTDPTRPIMYGIVLPGPDVRPLGIPVVKGGDVAKERLQPEWLCRTTAEIELPYARARLREGDVLVAIRGGIGDTAIAPASLEGANITQDVARVSPRHDVDPQWLNLVLRTVTVQSEIASRVTGATVRGLNIWDLKRVQVPSSDRSRQRSDLAVLSPDADRVARLTAAFAKQVSLMRERKQALITAAVTGQIDLAREIAEEAS